MIGARKIFWIEDITKDRVKRALTHAAYYKFESWDGYLLALMEDFGIKLIFTIDEKFKRVGWIKAAGLFNKK